MKYFKLKLKKEDETTKRLLELKGKKSYLALLNELIDLADKMPVTIETKKEEDFLHISGVFEDKRFKKFEDLAKKHNTTKQGLIKKVLKVS